jgi:hypothetical protein
VSTKQAKPRLWKAGTVWHCADIEDCSLKLPDGCGLTPWKAYRDWLQRRVRANLAPLSVLGDPPC